MENYLPKNGEPLKVIGNGGSSTVYMAYHSVTNEPVALKKLFIERNATLEIEILKSLDPHPNIIQFVECFAHNKNLCLIFEFADVTLASVLENSTQGFTDGEVCTTMKGLLSALAFLHQQHIMHRDVKPSNVLIKMNEVKPDASVKLSDMGLALRAEPGKPVTLPNAGTAAYQTPEILLGLRSSVNVHHLDAWASGCVLGELLSAEPMFSGSSAMGMIDSMFKVLGSPSSETWPEYKDLPNHLPDYVVTGRGLDAELRNRGCGFTDGRFLDLLEKLLTLNPATRLAPKEALRHACFEIEMSSLTPRVHKSLTASAKGQSSVGGVGRRPNAFRRPKNPAIASSHSISLAPAIGSTSLLASLLPSASASSECSLGGLFMSTCPGAEPSRVTFGQDDGENSGEDMDGLDARKNLLDMFSM